MLAKPRPKRSLGYIKRLISNKLFGTNKVVIVQPILANNETYQLFKIPGYDDIVIKVSRKEPHKEDKVKPDKDVDAVIVKPEMAIIGSYLGTTTQKETLFALEMVKSLLESGVLSAGRDVQKLVPIMPQPLHLEYFDQNVRPLKVFAQEQDQVFVPMDVNTVDNRNAFPMYPEYSPFFVSPEVKLTPVQSIYSYKQKGPEADMTYESYNNKDVIVTRTEKEPPLPPFIKLRIAEAATIGANPYAVRQPLRMNAPPKPVSYYVNQAMMIPDNVQKPYISHRIPNSFRNGVVQPEYMGNNIYRGPVDPVNTLYRFPNMAQAVPCKGQIVGKICPRDNVQVKFSDQSIASKVLDTPKQTQVANGGNAGKGESHTNANKIAVNEFLKNHTVNGQLISQYVYKQMNHHSHDNYTKVRVGEAPQLKDIAETSNKNLQKDYVLIPPENAESSMLNVLSLNNGGGDIAEQQNDNYAFLSKIKTHEDKYSITSLKSNEQSKEESLKQHPILVMDIENGDIKSVNFDENSRGDIPGATN